MAAGDTTVGHPLTPAIESAFVMRMWLRAESFPVLDLGGGTNGSWAPRYPESQGGMTRDNKPMDVARKSAASSVKLALRKRNLEPSQCGSSTFRVTLPEFDPNTGYWVKPTSVTPKPPRWLLGGRTVVYVPTETNVPLFLESGRGSK
jgi:hypothetical protein